MNGYLIAGYTIPVVLFGAYRLWIAARRRALAQKIDMGSRPRK